MEAKKKFRVRTGCVLAHHGEDLEGGQVVALHPHVGYDVRHLVEPVNDAGEVLATSVHAGVAALETELGKARPHEYVSLIEMAIGRKQVTREDAAELLATAKKSETAHAATSKKPAAPADAKGDAKK